MLYSNPSGAQRWDLPLRLGGHHGSALIRKLSLAVAGRDLWIRAFFTNQGPYPYLFFSASFYNTGTLSSLQWVDVCFFPLKFLPVIYDVLKHCNPQVLWIWTLSPTSPPLLYACLWKLELNIRYHPLWISILFFEIKSFMEPGTHQFARLTCYWTQDLPSPYHHTQLLDMGAGDMNSGPCAYAANTLPTKRLTSPENINSEKFTCWFPWRLN